MINAGVAILPFSGTQQFVEETSTWAGIVVQINYPSDQNITSNPVSIGDVLIEPNGSVWEVVARTLVNAATRQYTLDLQQVNAEASVDVSPEFGSTTRGGILTINEGMYGPHWDATIVDTNVGRIAQMLTAASNLRENTADANKPASSAVLTALSTKLGSTSPAVSAAKWTTARTLTLAGDLTGNVSLDGSTNVTLTTAIADDSHAHVIANVDGLQTALDGKLASSANAVSASKWATARTVTLAGDATGSMAIDGSANANLTVTVVDDSHNHVISNVDGLQAALDAKLASTDNAVSATRLATARTIALSGDATGSASFDGSANATLAVTVADDSHAHVIANVDGLQTALDGKLATSAAAVSAAKLSTARTLALTGDVTGSATFDGSANASITTVIADDSHNHVIANVDNLQTTIDAINTAVGARILASEKGAANGVATLGADSKIPAAQLPSYVDDVLEYAAVANFPATGESGKIYVETGTGLIYRWSGSTYVIISSAGLADTAAKLVTARTIALSGGATGSVSFDGSTNVTIATTVTNNGHTHTSANITDATNSNTANTLVRRDAGGNFSAGTITAALNGNAATATSAVTCSGNAATATRLATARTIALSGDATGSASFDGSANATLAVTVADDSHAHVIANVDGLQTALDGKLASSANAVSATKLATARTITLSGDVSGSTSFDGTGNVSIAAVVADSSHYHDASNLTSGTLPDGRLVGAYTGMTNLTGSGTVDFSKFLGNAGDSATAPSFSWTSDTNTGLYQPAADQLAITTGGVQRALFTGSGITATAFIGPLAGNASTATKLQTARTITLAGDATGSVSFDGSASTTLTVAVVDASHTHTSANISDATNASTANTVVKRDASGNFSAGTITATLAGNASSATTAAACSGNATTATKLATARTITLAGDASGSVSFDGSANVTLTVVVANDSHTHSASTLTGGLDLGSL